jgi:hypothetical protein
MAQHVCQGFLNDPVCRVADRARDILGIRIEYEVDCQACPTDPSKEIVQVGQ